MKINKKLIKELVTCLEENKLSELEYSEKDIKIKVARNSYNENSKIEILPKKAELKEDKVVTGIEIKSPIIGSSNISTISFANNSLSIALTLSSINL